MISTVILSTIYTNTISIGIVSSILLVIILAGINIMESSGQKKHKLLSKMLIIGAAPLLTSFLIIVIFKIVEILGE